LLEIDHLTKVYKGLAALDDVSLRVERAAVHAVVGEAGAGKTTLMKVLGGFLRAGDYAGDLRLQGAPLALRSPADALRAGIAIVPRKIALMENASVTENIALGSSQVQRSFWMSREADRAASQQLLHNWSMDIDPAAPVRSLGPLQRRLLMIARGLAVNPKVIVLDEPLTDVSGFHATAQLLRFVRRLAEHGLACLYLTQRVPDALVVANTITALRDGRVVETWPGPAFDADAITAALPGSRAGLVNPAADDFGESGGMFGPLNEYFNRIMGMVHLDPKNLYN
jgi:ABC-type sugar transport system ATPase subunit